MTLNYLYLPIVLGIFIGFTDSFQSIIYSNKMGFTIPSNNKISINSDWTRRSSLYFSNVPIDTEAIVSSVPFKETPTIPRRRDDTVSKLLTDVEFARAYIDESVQKAIQRMSQIKRGEALIFNRDETLAGIFTERDFITKASDGEVLSTSKPVSFFMTPYDKLIFVKETDKIGYCRKIMVVNKIRRLPVLDSQNKPIGIVTMNRIDRAIQQQDLELESATLYGDSLEQIQQKSKELANLKALEQGSALSAQDQLRGLFVFLGSILGAGLLQGNWIHDHEWLSMSLTFILGYIGIVFENYFEFNKAAIALLMSTGK